MAKSSVGAFETIVARPGGVLARGRWVPGPLASTGWVLHVDELAAALIDMALEGSDVQYVESADLFVKGKAILAAAKR